MQNVSTESFMDSLRNSISDANVSLNYEPIKKELEKMKSYFQKKGVKEEVLSSEQFSRHFPETNEVLERQGMGFSDVYKNALRDSAEQDDMDISLEKEPEVPRISENKLLSMIMKEMHMMGKSPYDMHDMKKDGTLVIDLNDEMWQDDEGRMAKSNLYKAAKACTMMHNMLGDEEQLEGWVQEKIAVASNMLQTVASYLEYQKVSGK